MLELLWQLPLLLWLSAFFSGSETALYSMSQVRVDWLVEQNNRRGRVLASLSRPMGPTIITILIGNNIVAEMLARTTERALTWTGSASILITTLVLTPLVLIFAEYLPKWIARRQADRVVHDVAYMLWGIRWLLVVPVALAQAATKMFQLLIPGSGAELWEPHASRSNMRTFFATQEKSEALSEVQQGLVDRVLALERITLAYKGVSKPLDVVEPIAANQSIAQARNGLGPKYFQRYLVAGPESAEPIGWISAATLVTADDEAQVSSLAQELPLLPADTPLHLALQQMHALGADLALVINERGEKVRVAFRGDCLRVLLQMER
jgi:putative hemolysin